MEHMPLFGRKHLRKPECIIFDLDGTISNNDHRKHFIEGPSKYWDAFNKACYEDTPILSTIKALHFYYNTGFKIVIVSGRAEEVRSLTNAWFVEKAGLENRCAAVYLRPAGDYRKAPEFKRYVLAEVRKKWTPLLAVDDDVSCVDMYFEEDVPCMLIT